MVFLDILSGAIKVAGNILGIKGADDVANAIKPDNIPPEKQAELQKALMEHEEKMKALGIEDLKVSLEGFKTSLAESTAMMQSQDKFVSRARPLGLYCAYAITLGIAAAAIGGVKFDNALVGEILLPLWGGGSFYVYQRTREKLAGTASQ